MSSLHWFLLPSRPVTLRPLNSRPLQLSVLRFVELSLSQVAEKRANRCLALAGIRITSYGNDSLRWNAAG